MTHRVPDGLVSVFYGFVSEQPDARYQMYQVAFLLMKRTEMFTSGKNPQVENAASSRKSNRAFLHDARTSNINTQRVEKVYK